MRRNRDFTALLTDRTGVAATEFALVLPLLLFLILASAVFFDFFTHRQGLERSLYTVGDVMSRKSSLSDGELDFMHELVGELVPVDLAALTVRVTSLEKTTEGMQQQWQRTMGPAWEGAAISDTMIPDIAVGDSVLVVQADIDYAPPFTLDVFSFGSIENVAVYRPRFVSSIAYQ